MAGIYFHIPFCKQACHYCDFHFSTNLKKKATMLSSMRKELALRKEVLEDTPIETIYFGGGTPSLLFPEEINDFLNDVANHFHMVPTPEITLEANPDDLSKNTIRALAETGINRLSIGVQSFFEQDLRLMNRAHNAREAVDAVQWARCYFDNISIDLIYGIPGMDNRRWQHNIEEALALGVPHISSYALTVEPRTALKTLIEKGKIAPVEEEIAEAHYRILLDYMKKAGWVNYEFSNFGKQGYFSKNNIGYWLGKPYLGIGPSAHSFYHGQRAWNIANNPLYINQLNTGELPFSKESLTLTDRYNEYVMTRLRTMWGVSSVEIEEKFGDFYVRYFCSILPGLLRDNKLELRKKNIYVIPEPAKFLTDGIAATLFYVD